MPTGGYHPAPSRDGGGVPSEKRIHEALNRARGTGYDGETAATAVSIENMAYARAITDVWETNKRAANQFDPARMTDMLPRWERILGLYPLPTDSDVARRAAVAEKFARFGKVPTRQRIYDELESLLGDVFVNLYTITIADSVQRWAGSSPASSTLFYSTVCHFLIKTTKPSGYTEGDFSRAVALIHPRMDALIPAWCTWDWYRNLDELGGNSWATDTSAGWFLDEELNLANHIFDS